MLVVATEADGLHHRHVGGAVGVRRDGVLHLVTGLGGSLRRTGHVPFVTVQVLQEPELHAPGGGAHLEGDLQLRAGQDGAVAVEQPVVVHPRTGDARVVAAHVQLVVAARVGGLQVVRDILDVADALDRVDARVVVVEGGVGVVQVLADGPLQRVRHEGLVRAFILDGSRHQVAGRTVDAHGVALDDNLVQVDGGQAQFIDGIHHHDGGGAHLQGAVHQRTPEGDVRNAAAREGGDVLRHVRGLGIGHRPGGGDFQLVHDEGRASVEGRLGTVQGDHVPHFHVAGALHVQVLVVLREDETARGDGGHLRGRDLRHGVIVQDGDFLDRQFLDTLVGVAFLLDGDAAAAFHGPALDQDGTGAGRVHDAARHVVGHGDGHFAHPLPRHRGHVDPLVGRIHRPGAVRVDLDGLRRGALRVEDEQVLAGRDGPGLDVLLLRLAADEGREGRKGRYQIS